MIGIDWKPLTFHELGVVTRSRRQEQWDHSTHITSHIMSLWVKTPIQPASLNPYRQTTKLDDPAAEYHRLVNESRNRSSIEVSDLTGDSEGQQDQVGTSEDQAS